MWDLSASGAAGGCLNLSPLDQRSFEFIFKNLLPSVKTIVEDYDSGFDSWEDSIVLLVDRRTAIGFKASGC